MRHQAAGEIRLFSSVDGVIQMLLQRELAALRDFGVVDLNLIDALEAMGSLRVRRLSQGKDDHERGQGACHRCANKCRALPVAGLAGVGRVGRVAG